MSRFLLSANVYFSLCLNLFLLMQLYTMELCHYFPPNISVVDGQCHNLIQRVCHRSILHHVHSWQCGIVLMFCIFNSFSDDLCPDITVKKKFKKLYWYLSITQIRFIKVFLIISTHILLPLYKSLFSFSSPAASQICSSSTVSLHCW